MPELNDIVDLAEHLLATINRVFAEEGVELPARQYYVIGGQGQTVHDEPQLTVSWDQAYSGLPGNEASIPARCDDIHTFSFVVEVVRPVTTVLNPEGAIPAQPAGLRKIDGRYAGEIGTVSAPSPEDFMRESRIQMQDAVLLLKAGLLAGEATLTANSIVDVSAGVPQGHLQATIMNFTATPLDSYYQEV